MNSATKEIILKEIKPIHQDELIRLGRDYDGGYVLSSDSLKNCKSLVSIGINNEWSFENDFVKITSKNVLMIDDRNSSGTNLKVLGNLIRSLFQFSNVGRKLRDIRRVLRLNMAYNKMKFLNGAKVKYKKHFLSDGSEPNSISLAEIKRIYSYAWKKGNVLLKIDIEGSEYLLIDDLLKLNKEISSLIIEFHYVIDNPERFLEALERLKKYFYVEHVHYNNYSPIDSGLCNTLELSFIHKDHFGKEAVSSTKEYPIKGLDFSNQLGLEDYAIAMN